MDSWSKYLKKIDNHVNQLDCDTPFYRGQGNIWSLLPSIFRNKGLTYLEENQLFSDFASYGASKMHPEMNSWDILFTMRHHGLPTRLLDWTESFSVALYFALQQNDDNPVIWVLDPYELNYKSTTKDEIFDPKRDLKGLDYYEVYIKHNKPIKKAYKLPIALYPEKRNERIFAQRGVFTLHGTLRKPLEISCPSCVKAFRIPSDAIKQAKYFNVKAGLNEYSLFPDFDGLSRYLCQKFNIDKK